MSTASTQPLVIAPQKMWLCVPIDVQSPVYMQEKKREQLIERVVSGNRLSVHTVPENGLRHSSRSKCDFTNAHSPPITPPTPDSWVEDHDCETWMHKDRWFLSDS